MNDISESMLDMLSRENDRLRKAGTNLATEAMRVAVEYDGIHRLQLAVVGWAKALADQHGRGD